MVFIKSYEISPQYKVSMAVGSSVISSTVSTEISVPFVKRYFIQKNDLINIITLFMKKTLKEAL